MAYTVLDSKNISKTKNIYTFGGSGTKPERDDIAENSKLTDYSSGEKFYYDPTKAAGNKWQPDKEPSGGGSLPANFPAEGIANANKFLGFDANGNYTAKEGGSGGGQFVVTLTATEEEGETTYSADKTLAEIVAARNAGKTVVLRYTVEGEDTSLVFDLQCDAAQAIEMEPGVEFFVTSFSGWGLAEQNAAPFYSVSGLGNAQEASWEVKEVMYANSDAVAPLPLTVNLTLDTSGENPTLVGDKTYTEILTAKSNGKRVMLKYDDTEGSGTLFCMDVLTAAYNDAGGKYHVIFCMGDAVNDNEWETGSDYFRYEMS